MKKPNIDISKDDFEKQIIKLGLGILWLVFCVFVLWRFFSGNFKLYLLATGIYVIWAVVYPDAGLGNLGKSRLKRQTLYVSVFLLYTLFISVL